MYGPAGLSFEVGALEGRGTIAGKPVRCETAEFQVRGHITYTPDETDYHDVRALCQRFGIQMPDIFSRL
jgi:lincosamide nucleotidyltransferase A/C/D/E